MAAEVEARYRELGVCLGMAGEDNSRGPDDCVADAPPVMLRRGENCDHRSAKMAPSMNEITHCNLIPPGG